MKEVKGYLSPKDIVHIYLVVMGWLIGSGVGIYLLKFIKLIIPFPWNILISLIISFLVSIYKIINRLNKGIFVSELSPEESGGTLLVNEIKELGHV